MKNDFAVSMDREHVNIDFLRSTDFLPNIIRNLNACIPFVCKVDNEIVAECLVLKDVKYQGLYDISNYAHSGIPYLQEAISHIIRYFKQNGGRYLDVGCGNAYIEEYALFQRLGFRVIGVLPDHYMQDSKSAAVENSIINRDMVRLRIDLNERTPATTGYDASGRA